MKKIFCIFILIAFIFTFTITVSAKEYISFDCLDTTCKNNRLVEIQVTAQSNKKLCAAYFEFSFDRTMFEFRKVTSSNDNSKVKANDDNNCIKVMYLNTWGEDISNNKVIFTITLKAIKAGTSYLNYTVEECVDEDVKFIEIGNCKASKITVTGKQSDLSSNKGDPKPSSQISTNKSNSEYSEQPSSSVAITQIGTISNDNNNFIIYALVGSVITLCIVAIIYMINMIIKSNSKNNNTKNKDGKS